MGDDLKWYRRGDDFKLIEIEDVSSLGLVAIAPDGREYMLSGEGNGLLVNADQAIAIRPKVSNSVVLIAIYPSAEPLCFVKQNGFVGDTPESIVKRIRRR